MSKACPVGSVIPSLWGALCICVWMHDLEPYPVCRRHQAAEAEGGGSSSAIRRRLALAAAEGRQLGPSGRCRHCISSAYEICRKR